MVETDKNSRFEAKSGLSLERLGDELLVLDKESEQIHRLNQTAAMIWEGLAAGRHPEEITAEFMQKFDTALHIAQQDIDRVTQQLLSLGLIRLTQAVVPSES